MENNSKLTSLKIENIGCQCDICLFGGILQLKNMEYILHRVWILTLVFFKFLRWYVYEIINILKFLLISLEQKENN